MTTDLSENFGIPNLTLTEENRPPSSCWGRMRRNY